MTPNDIPASNVSEGLREALRAIAEDDELVRASGGAWALQAYERCRKIARAALAATPAPALDMEAITKAIDEEERLIRGGMLPNMASDQHMRSWGEGARFVLGLVLATDPKGESEAPS